MLRHTASYYVILRHTNLEYWVIANHRSASGLQLAPHLTHAPSGQPPGRGASDRARVARLSLRLRGCRGGGGGLGGKRKQQRQQGCDGKRVQAHPHCQPTTLSLAPFCEQGGKTLVGVKKKRPMFLSKDMTARIQLRRVIIVESGRVAVGVTACGLKA